MGAYFLQRRNRLTKILTIPICPRTKKNHSQVITVGGRPRVIPSKQYTQFEKDCGYYINCKNLAISEPVNIKCVYFMDTHRKVDLINLLGATMDILVHYGVITDDNSKIAYSHDGSRVDFDKNNPRTEIEITSIGGDV